jgi:minor extracellular protease Epr
MATRRDDHEQLPRSKRFVVLPPSMSGDASTTDAGSTPMPAGAVRAHASLRVERGRVVMKMHAAAAPRGAHHREPPAASVDKVNVVQRAPSAGALLVEGSGSVATIQRAFPQAQVFPEKFYRRDRVGAPWLLRAGRRASNARSTGSRTFSVRVVDEHGQPLDGVSVTAVIGRQAIDDVTDARGRATLHIHPRFKTIGRLYADPLHSAWSVFAENVAITSTGHDFSLPSLSIGHDDARNLLDGTPAPEGQGVIVAVVDGGVGPHKNLEVAHGSNTTRVERSTHFADAPDGHGTHVAGVIASNAAGRRRGGASAVRLLAYRVFSAKSLYASNIAILEAISDAANRGCHLVNLSLGGGDDDGVLRRAIDDAWSRGCVCLAATGNEGQAAIDFPASYARVLAVTALGVRGSWPEGTYYDEEITDVVGRAPSGPSVFRAGFSNHGKGTSLTSPGLAIVSTLPNDRWGVMSGTSMATPVATGILARLIARAGLHTMPPNAARSKAIVALARAHAVKLGLPRGTQGHGLLR